MKSFFLLTIFFLFTLILNGTPFVFGDAYGYFHVGKTLVDQGTYPSSTEPEYYEYTGHAVYQKDTKYVTPYSVGQGLLYTPFLLVSSIFSNSDANTDYYKVFNGHSFADGLAILIASTVFAFLGLIFCYLFLKTIGFSKRLSFYSTLAVYFGLYLFSYTFEQAGYSHIYEFFAYSAFLYFLIKFFFEQRNKFLYLALVFAGLLVLIRVVDVVLIIPPFLYILYKLKSKKTIITSIFISLIFASIFLFYNYISYGNPFVIGYTTGTQSGFNLNFNLLNLLFSDTRGLVIWSPVVIFATIGLIMYSKKSKSALAFFIVPALLLILIYSFWSNWWGGYSIGQRFFSVLAPLFALGIAFFYTQIKARSAFKLVVGILVLFSFVTAILFRITPVTKLGPEVKNRNYSLTNPSNEDYRLSDIYKYHYFAFNNRISFEQYLNTLKNSFNGGRSIALLILGLTDPLAKVIEKTDSSFDLYLIPNNIRKANLQNVVVTFQNKSKTVSYIIANQNFSKPLKVSIECNSNLECSSDNSQLVKANADLNQLKFAKINENLKISVYAESLKVNFINLKTK